MSEKTPCRLLGQSRSWREIWSLLKVVMSMLPSVKESLPQTLNQVLIFLIRVNTFGPQPRTV